jgi:hypothetical protein
VLPMDLDINVSMVTSVNQVFHSVQDIEVRIYNRRLNEKCLVDGFKIVELEDGLKGT